MTSKTYSVGSGNQVRKLTDLILPWVDVSLGLSLPGITGSTLLDVCTDPTDGDKVFVVGGGVPNASFYGIAYSTDAGVTWNIPTGNYTSVVTSNSFKWFRLSVVDSNTIYVCGSNGQVCKSLDGGASFTLTNSIGALPSCPTCPPSIQDITSIHFLTDLVGVVGCVNHVLKTIDGGLTWTVLNGGNLIISGGNSPYIISGIHISSDAQTIVALGWYNVFVSIDGGTTWIPKYQWGFRNGRHLTSTDDNNIWGFGTNNEIIRTIDGGLNWTTIVVYEPISIKNHYAAHFYQVDKGFYSDNDIINTTTNGAVTGTLSETSPYIIRSVWTYAPLPTCTTLENCETQETLNVYIPDQSINPGTIIKFSVDDVDYPGCWEVIENNVVCDFPLTIDVTNDFQTCAECLPPCYLLTDCLNQTVIVSSDQNLELYTGTVIKLADCPDMCWTVELSNSCSGSVPISAITADYDSCEKCLPIVPQTPLATVTGRFVKPGYNTVACTPEYVEKIKCTFADEMYNEMLRVRYGITVCCGEGVDKWYIKNQLLNLDLIKDSVELTCEWEHVDINPLGTITVTIDGILYTIGDYSIETVDNMLTALNNLDLGVFSYEDDGHEHFSVIVTGTHQYSIFTYGDYTFNSSCSISGLVGN